MAETAAETVYPVVFFDALRVKISDEGPIRKGRLRGAGAQSGRRVLGLWIERTEGAKFWLNVVNELKTRGVNDILIAIVDGLKGFPEAIGVPADHHANLHRAPDPQ